MCRVVTVSPAPEDVCDPGADAVDPVDCADPPALAPVEAEPPADGADVVGVTAAGTLGEGTDVVVGSDGPGIVGVGVVGNGSVGSGLLVVVGRGGTVTETVGAGRVGTGTSASATRAPIPALNAIARSVASRSVFPASTIVITPFGRFRLRAK